VAKFSSSVSELPTTKYKFTKIHLRLICFRPWLSSLFYRTVDGKLWADLFTKLTGYTGRSINHKRRMISLAVESRRHLQNSARAIFHTKGAALASLLNDVDFAGGR
jgi:hypothetical protein